MDGSLVFLAGGLGRRYGGLKQLEGLGPGGETLLEYAVSDGKQSGFSRAVFVIRREMESAFREMLEPRVSRLMPVTVVFQEMELSPADLKRIPGGISPEREKPWGTGHALMAALPAVQGPFLMLNADDLYGPGAFRMAAEFVRGKEGRGRSCAVIAYRLEQTLSPNGPVSRGVIELDPEGRMVSVRDYHQVEQTATGIQCMDMETRARKFLAGDQPVSMNFLVLDPSIRSVVEAGWNAFLEERGGDPGAEFGVPDILDRLRREREGSIEVRLTDEKWAGVTHPEDAEWVRGVLAERALGVAHRLDARGGGGKRVIG